MSEKFEQVKRYVLDLDLEIVKEVADEELILVEDEASGIKNLIIDCEDPILILEQLIMTVPRSESPSFFKRLLQMNRTLVHGAFVLDDTGEFVFFRDTLQLENLDRNELEGSIHALSLALAEYAGELLGFAHR